MPSATGIAIPPLLLLIGLLAVPARLPAQQADSPSSRATEPTLDAILLRLQDNLNTYRASVPNFFCDEHLVSDMFIRNIQYRRTTTDSIFRLKRSGSTKPYRQFTESREIRFVNKRPAKDQTLSGPAIFDGGFSYALMTVSLEFKSCYTYRLLSHKRLHHMPVFIIEYTLKETARTDKACPGPEMNHGRALIDPQTMQIVRMEQQTPHHETNPGVYGLWSWSIDYAKVILNNKSFWMPKKITSTLKAAAVNTEWTFAATYRNYHELTVTSRILPGIDYDPKPR